MWVLTVTNHFSWIMNIFLHWDSELFIFLKFSEGKIWEFFFGIFSKVFKIFWTYFPLKHKFCSTFKIGPKLLCFAVLRLEKLLAFFDLRLKICLRVAWVFRKSRLKASKKKLPTKKMCTYFVDSFLWVAPHWIARVPKFSWHFHVAMWNKFDIRWCER